MTGNAQTARPAPATAASAHATERAAAVHGRARRSRNMKYEIASVIVISTTASDAP